jgi:murein DD-endopeptidase MepM/ murein hydrolase activator NlpD
VEIRIHIPRPLLTFTIVIVFILWWTGVISFHGFGGARTQADATGGERASTSMAQAVQDIDRERVKQAVLDRREEILRFELQILEQQALERQSPDVEKKLSETRTILLQIIRERSASEKLLALSLEQLWEAEGTLSSATREPADRALLWPVDPAEGLSATFNDAGYLERFGVPHHAIDIPVLQGSAVRAAQDGTVLKVADNGLGYSYIILSHEGNLETIYGHVSESLVQEGETIRTGQVIARSGGQPGTRGAGLLTTGPHLHFAVRVKGTLVDPLPYLAPMRG